MFILRIHVWYSKLPFNWNCVLIFNANRILALHSLLSVNFGCLLLLWTLIVYYFVLFYNCTRALTRTLYGIRWTKIWIHTLNNIWICIILFFYVDVGLIMIFIIKFVYFILVFFFLFYCFGYIFIYFQTCVSSLGWRTLAHLCSGTSNIKALFIFCFVFFCFILRCSSN